MVLLLSDQVEHVISRAARDLVAIHFEKNVARIDEIEQLTIVRTTGDVEFEQLNFLFLLAEKKRKI